MAGTWSNIKITKTKISADFAFDGSHAAPAAQTFTFLKGQGESGSYFVTDADVVFGSPAPNTITIEADRYSGAAAFSFTATASGPAAFGSPIQFDDSVKITISGNTTNSAVGTINLYIVPA